VVLERVQAHEGEAKSFSFAKDFSLLISAGEDGVKVWDPIGFKLLRNFRQDLPMNSAMISPLVTQNIEPALRKYHCIFAGGIPAREAA